MKEKLVCFDTETTGLNFQNDHIIQLSAIKIDSKTFEQLEQKDWYILPEGNFEIAPGAFKAHGITKEFLQENGLNLRDVAPEFLKFIEGCDLLSYNGNKFDIQMVTNNFAKIGIMVDWTPFNSYDSYYIETILNPRNLSSVYKKYTGEEMEGAHNSFNDVTATIEIFKHQMKIVNMDEYESEFGTKIISPENSLTKLDDKIVFNMGKYSKTDVAEVCKKDPKYITWFFENVASQTTKQTVKDYYYNHK